MPIIEVTPVAIDEQRHHELPLARAAPILASVEADEADTPRPIIAATPGTTPNSTAVCCDVVAVVAVDADVIIAARAPDSFDDDGDGVIPVVDATPIGVGPGIIGIGNDVSIELGVASPQQQQQQPQAALISVSRYKRSRTRETGVSVSASVYNMDRSS